MSATATRPAQTTRQRKVECVACGVIVRMSRAAMLKSGLPTCGCGTPMTCSDLDDLAAVAPEDPRVQAAIMDAERFVERSLAQMNRQARRHGRGSSIGLGPQECRDLAAERAYAAVKARDAAYHETLVATRSFTSGCSDDMPF